MVRLYTTFEIPATFTYLTSSLTKIRYGFPACDINEHTFFYASDFYVEDFMYNMDGMYIVSSLNIVNNDQNTFQQTPYITNQLNYKNIKKI